MNQLQQQFNELESCLSVRSEAELDQYARNRWQSDHKDWGPKDLNNPYWRRVIRLKHVDISRLPRRSSGKPDWVELYFEGEWLLAPIGP